ncbi:hypothetical protein B5S28_g2882 [[Candida] boidinii]|nr:hypothetical protein B5S28_g2882 [[Candida] boidinii]OWB59618.1 hypothetical protein B5S29_g478 [[Candida] boidinii]OWB72784.1 hypothetical protein B5S31_g2506 [[Candida] boidinii]OWB77678.1 hypothetical protein B5S32_g1852 [[Candida] boidinii]
MSEEQDYAIVTENLTYTFPQTNRVGLYNINLKLDRKSRLLLIGPNGAGKSTLLKILAGQKLIKSGKILLNGIDPFAFNKSVPVGADGVKKAPQHNVITYLGTEWANNGITQRDIPVTVLIESIGGNIYPERRDLLINLLDVDINWRMNQISDGERRRIQLIMGLLKPWDLLLLDEVTVDLDVLVRSRLLDFLEKETQERNCTIVYATHIFDGLGSWPTRIMHLSGGCKLQDYSFDKVKFFNSIKGEVDDQELRGAKRPSEDDIEEDEIVLKIKKTDSLHPLALAWLYKDLELRGERTEDKTRPKFEDLAKKMTEYYYDDKDRVTEYFMKTRRI